MQFFVPPLPSRYFTPDEANALLKEVRAYLEGAIDLEHKTRQLEKGLIRGEEHPPQVERLEEETRRLVAKIREFGVEVKALSDGILDFPALRNGELVYLCWRLGEERVEHWHPARTGFRSRQRIDATSNVRWEWRN